MIATPLDHRVLIKMKRADEKSTGGIIIPEDVRDKNSKNEMTAVIVKLGETAFINLYVKPEENDEVLIARYSGSDQPTYSDDEYEYRLVNDTDIKAICQDIDIKKVIKELRK